MKNHFATRLLAMLLVFALLLGFAVPFGAYAADGIRYGLISNSAVSNPLRPKQTEERNYTVPYDDDDIVRVSIVLHERPTLHAGFSTQSISDNTEAMRYRQNLRDSQAAVTARIEKQLGQKLDVVWNLTLAANLISANVAYGQIKSILAVPGVKQVVLETRYMPMEAVSGAEAKPNMTVSSNMTGATQVWETGYTGGGTRIAIVDTGLDTDHQSFDPDAYAYALMENAAQMGLSFETYLAEMDLLDAAELAEKLPQLNVAERKPNLTAEELYFKAAVHMFSQIKNGEIL